MFLDDKPQGEVTEAPAKKLSEAIRIGAKLSRQCAHKYIDGDAACAFGAAALGLGGGLELAKQLHSECNEQNMAFYKKHGLTITGANDRGSWTREAIADALEALGW